MSTDEIINKIGSFFVKKPLQTEPWVTHKKVKQTQKQMINAVLEIRAQEWRRDIADLAGCTITEVSAISPIDNVAIESFITRHRHTMPDADADRVRAAFRAIITGARYR